MMLIVGGGYGYYRQRQSEKPPVTVTPQIKDLTQTLQVSGLIDASQSATLSFPAAAKLTWVGVKEGDWVKQWQGVAAVDVSTLQKQMAVDQNLHGKEFRAFEQTLEDNDYYGSSGLNPSERRTVESAQLDLKNTALAAEIRDIAIKNAYLTSPIAGIVTRVDRPVANLYILPTDQVVIVDPQTIYFRVIIDEEDVSLVKPGQAVMISLDAYPETEIEGQVIQIAFAPSTTESGSLGYAIKISLPVNNEALLYRLGMNGDANIVLAQKSQVLTVPLDSLISRDELTYVEIYTNGNINQKEVKTGIEGETEVEILAGLTGTEAGVVPERE